MKLTINSEPLGFRPVNIEFTLETLDEVEDLYRDLGKCNGEVTLELYRQLSRTLQEIKKPRSIDGSKITIKT